MGQRPRQLGFTLVELLVVIGIIAVLIGILLPVMGKARHQGWNVACQSNLKQIYLATEMYANENHDRFPGASTTGNYIFRRAPGDRDPANPTYAEVLGLAAVLHGLQEIDKYKVTGPLDLPKPRYLSGRNAVWLCPAATDESRSFNNTYAFSIQSQLEKDSLAGGRLDPAWVTTKRRNTSVTEKGALQSRTWVFDNINQLPGLPGKLGPFTGAGFTTGTVDKSRFIQHQMGSRKRGAWYIYLDGHTGFDEKG